MRTCCHSRWLSSTYWAVYWETRNFPKVAFVGSRAVLPTRFARLRYMAFHNQAANSVREPMAIATCIRPMRGCYNVPALHENRVCFRGAPNRFHSCIWRRSFDRTSSAASAAESSYRARCHRPPLQNDLWLSITAQKCSAQNQRLILDIADCPDSH